MTITAHLTFLPFNQTNHTSPRGEERKPGREACSPSLDVRPPLVQSNENEMDEMGFRLAKQRKNQRMPCPRLYRDLSPTQHPVTSCCTRQIEPRPEPTERRTSTGRREADWCLLLRRSLGWWTAFPRCRTFNAKTQTILSSPSGWVQLLHVLSSPERSQSAISILFFF